MALTSGTRLGLYEILSILGAGGMGEVYRARDTKLGREVAVKVLPEAFAFDPERVARFKREAQVLASLNHPHIAALYGMEEAPSTSSGQAVHFLIMELVEGETLADRLRRGPVPVEEALKFAHQITDALEAAHEKGVVHRDLKPANVKITPDEKVKVLDFGLAKAMEPAVTNANLTNSPTLSLAATQAGMILGTAAYMSPEQAKGLSADARSDVFSFGVVLYELLTGRQPFQGETAPDILASVLIREADLALLPPNLNSRLPELLKRCLEKSPKRRWQAVGDLRAEIEAITVAPHAIPAATSVATQRQPLWHRLAFIGAPALIAGIALSGATVWLAMRPSAPHTTRFALSPTGAATVDMGAISRDVAISPDGTHIVYDGRGTNGTQFFVRALDQLDATPVVGLGGQPRSPFLSPDGQWIGFADASVGGTAKKVAITGGPALTLFHFAGLSRGFTWGDDDTIVFASSDTATGLQRVSAAGGEPTVLTKPNRERGEDDHLWPQFLPGSQAVLFTITPTTGGVDASQVAVLNLRTGAQKIVLRGGSQAHYVSSGHLVYAAAGTLRAVAFDIKRLEVIGTPSPVVPAVLTAASGVADFDIARDGPLVYALGGQGAAAQRTLVWVDRQGHEEPIKSAPIRSYVYPRLSPDGTRIAVDIRDQENDIWVWDIAGETLTRVTFDPGLDRSPAWTPDGRRLVFSSQVDGNAAGALFWRAADGTGTAERLTQSSIAQLPSSVSPDGTRVVFWSGTQADVSMVTLDKDHRVQPLVQTAFMERNGEISPDGRWLAYESTDSGRSQIFVRPFPDVNSGHWQVPTDGGTRPLWARNGRELFYVSLSGALMSVRVEPGSTWKAGSPVKLFEGPYYASGSNSGRTYDVSPDGRRFLMIKDSGADAIGAPPSLVVVENWFEELRRLVPTTR